jgi:DNA-binding NarL/FixJ family response regulator
MSERPINVLIIEDNPGDVRLIQEALASVNGDTFNLMPFESLSSALRRLAEGGIDVVLLDLALPDSLGLDSFNSVQAKAPDVPIVVLSGLDHRGVAGEAVRSGAHFYLVKSKLMKERLDQIILQAIERQRMRREISRVRRREQEAFTQAEMQRQTICDELAAGEPDSSPYPDDSTLFGLCDDYRELALHYVRATRSDEPRPVAEIRLMAQHLAEIHAGGHHAIRLHQRSLSDLAPEEPDPALAEDARLLVIELMGRLVDIYLKAY